MNEYHELMERHPEAGSFKLPVIEDDKEKYAILGAFELYLDFINLFLDILKLFAKSRD